MNKFVVGIAARNEENGIFDCLRSVEKALLYCNKNSQIIVCLNNCTDNTELEVIRFASASNVEIAVHHSTGNLISAQRTIFESTKVRPVVFVDADTRISEKTLKNLIKEIKGPVVLTYARSNSQILLGKQSIATRVFNIYQDGLFLSKRYYFHGRVFATKEWNFPSELEILERAYKTNSFHLLKYGKGLLLDDVYLSAYLLINYGDESIREVINTDVQHKPIARWKDWWKTYRRVRIEMIKIETWFNEFDSLRPKLYRKTNWNSWRKASLQEKILWFTYLGFKYLSFILVELEMSMAKFTRYKPSDQWKVAEGTKLISDDRKLIMFDIDGTLIHKDDMYYMDSTIKNSIQKMLARGALIGIATSRSFEGAIEIYKSLSMNGPLIVEGGGRTFLNQEGRIEEVLLKRHSDIHKIITNKIERYIKIKSAGFSLKTNSDLKSLKSEGVQIHISKNRVNSASIYVYKNGHPDKSLALDLYKYLNSVLLEHRITAALGFENGKLHVHFLDVSKNSTLSHLKYKYFKSFALFMIGDAETTESNSGIFYLGVNHSDDVYKNVCSYVTPYANKHGIIDLINYTKVRY